MRRRHLHATFGAIALGCAVGAAYQGVYLYRAHHVNAAIASASMTAFAADGPEARFTRALALARARESEAAVKAYKALIVGDRLDLRQRARYNLGNLYMRDALAQGTEQAFRSLPLIELAKQSYRDLLRVEPYDWDARYNLERALWLAPESDEPTSDEEPPEQEQTPSTVQGARIDLP